jgi:hypothetical protein
MRGRKIEKILLTKEKPAGSGRPSQAEPKKEPGKS